MPATLLITDHVVRQVFTSFREDPGGRSCSCVRVRRRFRPGESFAVQEELGDGRTFCLAGVGRVTLPGRAFALSSFRDVFAVIWAAAPSVVAVSHRLRALGFRGWTPRRVCRYAGRLDDVKPLLGGAPSVN